MFTFIAGGGEATVPATDTVQSISAFRITMTYFEEDAINDDGDRVRDVERNHDGGGEYVKLVWDPQPEAVPTHRGGSSRLWYWVKLVLCFLCLGLLALVAFKWVVPLFTEKVSSYSSFQMSHAF